MSHGMPTPEFEAVNILETLESGLAYLPGGRDREGRPLVVVNVPPGESPSTTKSKLKTLLEYYLSIFSEDTKQNGLCLLIDARYAVWRVARTFIRLSTLLLGKNATSAIAVRPDGFWDKRVDNCTKSHKEGEPVYIPISRLYNFIDPTQLTYDLGGTKPYDHTEWIQSRVRIEEHTNDALKLITKMTDLRDRLRSLEGIRSRESKDNLSSFWEIGTEVTYAARRILHTGRSLISSMSRDSAQDVLDAVQEIHKVLDSIELKQVEVENAWTEMERNLDTVREIKNLEEGVSKVTNWILGPADSMLNARYHIGFDVASSEELRREHEKLELECRDTYGRYAELLHRIDNVPNGCISDDLKSQRDFMDFVCRSFATRLERRRNVLITSQRFFRLVSEYFDKTSEVFDKLIMGNRSHDYSQAEAKLQKLEKSQAMLETLENDLVKEGEKLSDILSMPVKDALCRDVHVDYEEDIINVRDILDATNARKNIFNDSVELQKLTLKQIGMVHTYESDAEQAVLWLDDLFDVLLGGHVEIGCNMNEIQSQKEEHQSFQDTAKGTFEYGCQLINGARVLRLSCKLPLEENTDLLGRLRQAWRQLHSVGQEQLTRLRVCAVFHRNVDDHCKQLTELIQIAKNIQRKRKSKSETTASPETDICPKEGIREVLIKREKLLPEVGRMVRLGRLLRTRLKEPLRMSDSERRSPDESGNLSAIESISNKLMEVTELAEKLDAKLSEAGARNRGSPENLETDLVKSDDKFVGNSSSRLSSPRLVSSTAEMMKKEERKETLNETSDEKKSTENVDDSNIEEYVTATECSTTPVFRSRSESILTCSEYEDAVNALARSVDQASSPIEYVIPTISEKKSEPAIIKPIAIKSTVTGPTKQEATECDRAVTIQRFTEEKTGKVVKEVTETTTLRVSQDTRMGVSSYKLVSNTTHDNHEHCDIKKMQDLKLTLESEAAPGLDISNSEITKNDVFCKKNDLDPSKQANGNFSGFDSKSWSCEQEEQSYASNVSNGSASMIKYNQIKMIEARQANVLSSNYERTKEESKDAERGVNGGFEEAEFFTKARMVSRAEEISQYSKFRMALHNRLSACE
ncbi:SEC14 domain and spectrin repeat-containing protein 1-B isoform X2 [Belonocnema kinseyi]|uniref:SEC14 domain and spectrin repeat-containing protein 1-B isoform X2 n=1 Tax=Belonocnema kinseyi TaxID=2817044 RepID=UPI00143D4A5A|nr:SEC14 domain and spectrin repeat-containing protein 1-B isoform X2 [Belonocnema kinseyi]